VKAAEVKNKIVWDWMKPDLVTVRPDTTLEEAASVMRKLDIHHLLVMDGKNFIGLLDARDCAGLWDKNQKVRSIARTDIPVVDEDTEVCKVIELILSHRFTALPLKRKGEIQGIITSTDCLRLLNFQFHSHTELRPLIERGTTFFTKPLMQSLMHALESAGL